MKIIAWITGVILTLVIAVFGLQMLASERVEVIELHAADSNGEMQTTRLWIVDHDGYQYLRGDNNSGWYQRIRETGSFKVTRGNETVDYTFELRPEKVDTINQLFHDKYTWGDEVIDILIGGREGALAIQLNPKRDEERG